MTIYDKYNNTIHDGAEVWLYSKEKIKGRIWVYDDKIDFVSDTRTESYFITECDVITIDDIEVIENKQKEQLDLGE